MAGWFARLMQESHARSSGAGNAAGLPAHDGAEPSAVARDARYDAVVRTLRERAPIDRAAREQRQRGYRQSLESDPAAAAGAAGHGAPTRLHRFRTKVPCRVTPEARALLDQLRRQFPRGMVSFQQLASGRQAVMLTRGPGSEPRQVGWVEHCVETDPRRCNVRHQGLAVETDGGSMLVLRFRYPHTPVRVTSHADDARRVAGPASMRRDGDGSALPARAGDTTASAEFSELRPAMELRPADKAATPRLVWVTRREADTLAALESRDYEAFYVRLKREVLAGVWGSLTALLASAPASRWHRGAHYTVVREPDADRGRIYQRTVDDAGRTVDVGANRVHDAASATDILLLHLDEDILADVADIYFTLRSQGSADAYFLKEELFAVVRRFWAGSQSLVSRFGSDLATVLRMSQRAMPMPAQASLLRQDWMNLRQSLVDRYGEGGEKAAALVGRRARRPRTAPAAWPFATFAAGDVNVGLRLVYRQEWRELGAQRGEVLRTLPSGGRPVELEPGIVTPGTSIHRVADGLRSVDTTIRTGDGARTLDAIVRDAVDATVHDMKWPLDLRGCIDTGVRGLAAITDVALEAGCRESIRDGSARLADVVMKMAGASRDRATVAADAASTTEAEASPAADDGERAEDEDAATRVYSRLQHRYEVVTRAAEIQNVVLVAERLPAPAEVDRAWVTRHDWILSKVLLDESFRDALETIGRDPGEEQLERRNLELHAKRERLYEHVRTNILHYQRAIWQREDPQQRCMRYRKLGRKVPLDWRFELGAGDALTIDELGTRLCTANVDGQFAAYSGGREADLDQVIDPAGLVGYYGNYAVYQMRPELGSADAFAMLHFFKSPHLQPNPETGEAAVGDPVSLPVARRVVLDTDGVVIDVVRGVAPPAEEPARADAIGDAIVAGAMSARCELLLDGARGVGLLHAKVHRDADDAWALLRAEGMPSLRAGTGGGAARAGEPEVRPMIEPRDDAGATRALQAGRAPEPTTAQASEPAIHAREGARSALTIGAGVVADERAPALAIAAANDQAGALLAGRRHADEPLLPAVDDAPRLRARPDSRASDAPAIAARGSESPPAPLHAGHAPAPREAERGIVAGGDARPMRALLAGAGAPLAGERAIVPRDDAARGLVAIANGGAPRRLERPPLAADDGVPMPDLLACARATVGRAHDASADPVVGVRGDEGRMLRVRAGRANDAVPERAIHAREGGATPRLTVIAGGGAAHAHERTILAKDDGWLRPTLVAG